MRNRLLLAGSASVLAAALLTGLAPLNFAVRAAAAPQTYAVDPGHSAAMFRVIHLGAGAFWGRFNAVSGSIAFDATADDGLSFDVSIDTNSIDSGMDNLDAHLKNADFFDVENHGTMTFKSLSAKRTRPKMYEVKGNLTMRGVTKEITAMVEHTGTADMGRGARVGFEAIFTVKRSEYGIMYGVENGALGDETRIIVAMEARQAPARAAQAEPAEETAGGLPARWADRDTNGDGKIQKDEMPERARGMFDRLDTNGDGVIDAKEIAARRGGRGG